MKSGEKNIDSSFLVRSRTTVKWVVDCDKTIIINSAARVSSTVVGYPGAAIWDLLMQGYSIRRTTEITAILEGCVIKDANAMVEQYVTEWKAAGFLEESSNGA